MMAEEEVKGKVMKKGEDKTSGLYKIAAQILKNVKTGGSYKTQLYNSNYPNKMLLNAVLMNVFKWEKVIDVLVDKTDILSKEFTMNRELIYVLITELMWSKVGLKGGAKNINAIKKYKTIFLRLMEQHELETLRTSLPSKVLKPRFFRVNTLVTTIEDVIKKLALLKFNKLKTPKSYAEFLELIKSDKLRGNTFVQDIHIKELLVFNSKVKFFNLEDYKNGSLIIQDKASCMASYLLNPEPGSTVLDMCAAPGMKTSHLAAIMHNEGKLYAVDRCQERFIILQSMLQKYNVTNAETFNMDALTFPYYDNVKYVLVDPSCSGSGIVDRVRNNSTQKNENFQLRLKKLANVHAQILNHALKSYPDIERLVYSTCSANPEENEVVVDEALSVNGNFKLLDASKLIKGWINKGAPGYDCSEKCINAVSNVDCTNGFFIAVFVRRDYEEIYVDDCKEDSDIDENISLTKLNKKKDKRNKSSKKLHLKAVNNLENDDSTSQLEQDVDMGNTLSVKSKKLKRDRSLAKKNKNSIIKESLKTEFNIDDITTQFKADVDTDGMLSGKSEKLKRDRSLAKKNKNSKIKESLKAELNTDEGTSQSNGDVDMDSTTFKKTEKLKMKSKKIEKSTKIKQPGTSIVKSKNAKRRARRLKLEQCIEKLKTAKIN